MSNIHPWTVAMHYTKYTPANGIEAYRMLHGTPPEVIERERVAASEARKADSKYPGLFSGNLRSLQSRQKWVKDNADYLKSQGWSDSEITGYLGLNLTNSQRANLNIKLSKVIGGLDDFRLNLLNILKEQLFAKEREIAESYGDGERHAYMTELNYIIPDKLINLSYLGYTKPNAPAMTRVHRNGGRLTPTKWYK